MVYITYNMGNRDLPDIYAHALGPAALGLGHIYQANPSCPCYNYYICHSVNSNYKHQSTYVYSYIRRFKLGLQDKIFLIKFTVFSSILLLEISHITRVEIHFKASVIFIAPAV